MKNDGQMIPKKVFFTKGVGRSTEKLQSFELALRDASIAKYNIVDVSSILPPSCKILSKEQGVVELKDGQILFCVLSRNETKEPNRLIASSIGCAVPADEATYGYLSEHKSFGETAEVAGDYAEDVAATMLASTLGIKFDPGMDWDERLQEYKMSGKIVKTRSITQSAIGDKDGLWTTVIAAAVFIMEEEETIKSDLEKTKQIKLTNPDPNQKEDINHKSNK